MIDRPQPDEYAPFYAGYVAAVPPGDVLDRLAAQPDELARLAAATGAERETFRYAPDKWSVREIFGHLIDAERVFGYRAFRIGRGDTTPLSGFDQEPYVARGGYDEVPLADSAAELARARASTLDAVRRALPAALACRGVASGNPVSFRALLYILVGHVEHHRKVLAERYGVRA
jgi:hypothetical protein